MADDEIARLIEQLKRESSNVRSSAAEKLGRIGDISAVPALIEALKDKYNSVRWKNTFPAGSIAGVRASAAHALNKIVKTAETIEDFETIEKGIMEGSKAFRKEPGNERIRIEAQFTIAGLLKEIAEIKNTLVTKTDLLLPDTIKPPKKGDVYNAMRRIRNG